MTSNSQPLTQAPFSAFVATFKNLYDRGNPDLDQVTKMAERDIKKIGEEAQKLQDLAEAESGQALKAQAIAKKSKVDDSHLELAKILIKDSHYATLLIDQVISKLNQDPKYKPYLQEKNIKLDIHKFTTALHVAHLNNLANVLLSSDEVRDDAKKLSPENLSAKYKSQMNWALHNRNILQLSITAKEQYYGDKNSIVAKVAGAFQNLKMKLGIKTSVEKAKETLDRYNQFISTGIFESIKTVEKKIRASVKIDFTVTDNLDAQMTRDIFRHLAIREKETVTRALLGTNNPNGKDEIYIAKPNGDVYVLDLNTRLGSGSSRTVYKATLYSMTAAPKEVAITTTLQKKSLLTQEEIFTNDKETLELNTKRMREEQQVLNRLSGIKGIIKIHDCIHASLESPIPGQPIDTVFAVADLYTLGNLDNFLNPNAQKHLSDDQKKHLISSLLNLFYIIEQRGELHRDIKLENILVKFNPETNLYDPVLIDFENYISKKDTKRKQEAVSTITYWPPEFMEKASEVLSREGLSIQGKDSLLIKEIAKLTNSKSDTWSLGLVLYRIFYGEDFLTNLGFNIQGKNQLAVCEELNGMFNNVDKCFPDDKLTPLELIIKSMLSINPDDRPTMKSLVGQLR